MLAKRLIKLIETRADKIGKMWLKEVRQNRYTPTYHVFDEDILFQRARRVYQELEYWLSPETKKEEIRRFYMELGRERYKEGFELEEVIMAIILLKRFLWLEIMSEGLLSTNVELYQALELNNRVVLYFDRAVFFTCAGYREMEHGNKSYLA